MPNENKHDCSGDSNECLASHFGPCDCAEPSRRLRSEAIVAAARCGTCSRIKPDGPVPHDLDTGAQPKPCLGKCTREISYYSCAPGYCRICAHDPRWVSIEEALPRETSPRVRNVVADYHEGSYDRRLATQNARIEELEREVSRLSQRCAILTDNLATALAVDPRQLAAEARMAARTAALAEVLTLIDDTIDACETPGCHIETSECCGCSLLRELAGNVDEL